MFSFSKLDTRIKKAIWRGISLLDEHEPLWVSKTNPNVLKQQWNYQDVLSQVFGSYEEGLYTLGIGRFRSSFYGFTVPFPATRRRWYLNDHHWKNIIFFLGEVRMANIPARVELIPAHRREALTQGNANVRDAAYKRSTITDFLEAQNIPTDYVPELPDPCWYDPVEAFAKRNRGTNSKGPS